MIGSWVWEGDLPDTAGGTLTMGDASEIVAGFPSIEIDQGSGSLALTRFEFDETDELTIQAYVRTPDAWPSAAWHTIITRPSSSIISARGSIAGQGAPGQVRLYQAGAGLVTSSSTGTIEPETWYRTVLNVNHQDQEARLRVFALGVPLALYDTGWREGNFGDPSYRVEVGSTSNSPRVAPYAIAGIEIYDTADLLPEPLEGLPGADRTSVMIWDGEALQPVSDLHYWDGTQLHGIKNLAVSGVVIWE